MNCHRTAQPGKMLRSTVSKSKPRFKKGDRVVLNGEVGTIVKLRDTQNEYDVRVDPDNTDIPEQGTTMTSMSAKPIISVESPSVKWWKDVYATDKMSHWTLRTSIAEDEIRLHTGCGNVGPSSVKFTGSGLSAHVEWWDGYRYRYSDEEHYMGGYRCFHIDGLPGLKVPNPRQFYGEKMLSHREILHLINKTSKWTDERGLLKRFLSEQGFVPSKKKLDMLINNEENGYLPGSSLDWDAKDFRKVMKQHVEVSLHQYLGRQHAWGGELILRVAPVTAHSGSVGPRHFNTTTGM